MAPKNTRKKAAIKSKAPRARLLKTTKKSSKTKVAKSTRTPPATPVSKRVAAKARPFVAATVSPAATEPAVEAPVAVQPQRAPVRKIVGPNRTVTVISLASAPATSSSPQPEESTQDPSSSSPELSVVPPSTTAQQIQANEQLIRELPRNRWNELPRSFPPQIRFLLSGMARECGEAATWPFPFAKFLSALPEKICGVDLGLLILSLDHSVESVSRLTAFETNRISASLERGMHELNELFSSTCSDMARRWRSQLSAPERSLEPLIEQYLLAKVDRDFQVLIGTILFRAVAAQLSRLTSEQGQESRII